MNTAFLSFIALPFEEQLRLAREAIPTFEAMLAAEEDVAHGRVDGDSRLDNAPQQRNRKKGRRD